MDAVDAVAADADAVPRAEAAADSAAQRQTGYQTDWRLRERERKAACMNWCNLNLYQAKYNLCHYYYYYFANANQIWRIFRLPFALKSPSSLAVSLACSLVVLVVVKVRTQTKEAAAAAATKNWIWTVKFQSEKLPVFFRCVCVCVCVSGKVLRPDVNAECIQWALTCTGQRKFNRGKEEDERREEGGSEAMEESRKPVLGGINKQSGTCIACHPHLDSARAYWPL